MQLYARIKSYRILGTVAHVFYQPLHQTMLSLPGTFKVDLLLSYLPPMRIPYYLNKFNVMQPNTSSWITLQTINVSSSP